jgi:hypothetical protein
MESRIIRTKKTKSSGIITAGTTALAANPGRCSYIIQNLGTSPLFVKEGAGASATVFDYILAAATGNDNGTGASYETPSDQVFTGLISIYSAGLRCTASERTVQDSTN